MCFMTEGMVKMVKGKMVKAGGFQPGQTVALITTLWCAWRDNDHIVDVLNTSAIDDFVE